MSFLFPNANGTDLGIVSAGTNITITNGVISAASSSVIGNWTPVISVDTAGTITLSVNTGRFAKMGQQVICYFDITVATRSGGTNGNVLTLTGLPFASIAGTGNVGSLIVSYFSSTNSDNTYLSGTVAGTSTSVSLFRAPEDSTAMVSLTYADLKVTTQLVGTITYLSAS